MAAGSHTEGGTAEGGSVAVATVGGSGDGPAPKKRRAAAAPKPVKTREVVSVHTTLKP